jgi:hypothetical protein
MSNQQYSNENSGALFRNERKETERHPDHTGNAQIKCPHCGEVTEFWLAAWVKQAKNGGRKFFSLAFTGKEAQRKQQEERNFDGFDKDDPAF